MDVSSAARTTVTQTDIILAVFGASITVAGFALVAIGVLGVAVAAYGEGQRLPTRSKLRELAIHAFIVFDLAVIAAVNSFAWLLLSSLAASAQVVLGRATVDRILALFYWFSLS